MTGDSHALMFSQICESLHCRSLLVLPPATAAAFNRGRYSPSSGDLESALEVSEVRSVTLLYCICPASATLAPDGASSTTQASVFNVQSVSSPAVHTFRPFRSHDAQDPRKTSGVFPLVSVSHVLSLARTATRSYLPTLRT